jgi:hypothetical protein
VRWIVRGVSICQPSLVTMGFARPRGTARR